MVLGRTCELLPGKRRKGSERMMKSSCVNVWTDPFPTPSWQNPTSCSSSIEHDLRARMRIPRPGPGPVPPTGTSANGLRGVVWQKEASHT